MTIKRFEDIQGWQEARKLTNMVFEIFDKRLFSKNYRAHFPTGQEKTKTANLTSNFGP